ncbi:hypothetical protein NW752_008460 [Fusarium irregulare]|nr:hypothetical protein NW752_008460 [Fusarium irregulare]
MSSSNEPPGYACLVLQDWDARALNVQLPTGLRPALKVTKGEEVFVFQTQVRADSSWGYTQRPEGNEFKRGWVPLNILKKGNRVVEPLPIELPAAHQTFAQNPNNLASENVLQETLRDLWRSVKASETALKNVIPSMSEKSIGILFHQRAHEYGDCVYNALLGQARTIMSNGNFSVETLRTLPQVSAQWPKQAGIYMILYEIPAGIRVGGVTYTTIIYIGQTIGFQGRKSAHIQNKESKNSIHYRLARQAQNMVMVPLLLLPQGPVPHSFLDIAEFSLVCLMRSWYALLFRPAETSVIGSYALDYDACLAFSGLMREVSQRTGWNPGRTYGVNWHTPICTHPRADSQWTSWYDRNDETYVYRTRKKLMVRASATEIYWQAERKIGIPTALAREAGFQNGQSVHLVVEVKKRGNEYLTHPFRFVRYPPMIGPNPELEKLRSLAVQIQWLDNQGQWKAYYLERQRTWTPLGNTGIPEIYRQALFILCNVEQTVYTNPPVWTMSTAPARIHYLRYDHLAQKMVLQVIQPQQKAWPPDNTMAQNTQRLLQQFPAGPNADTLVGQRPANPRSFYGTSRTMPCTFSRGHDELINEFIYGNALQELGVAPHMARAGQPMAHDLDRAPFNPDIEAEGQGELADI